MSRQWIKQLAKGQTVSINVCILHGEVKPTQNNGNLLSLTLCDRTGKIAAVRFQPSDDECEQLATIRYALVRGMVGEYNGKRQIKLSHPLKDIGVPDDLDDLLPCSPVPLPELLARLQSHIASVTEPGLNALLHAVLLENKKLSDRFAQFPAALTYHHAFRHGLLQHTLEVTDVVSAVVDRQHHWGGNPILRDLAVAGALLHDIGKVEEMDQHNHVYEFTPEGNLLGHILLGNLSIARAIARLRKSGIPFSPELEHHLLHLISSHHGKGEWGSPKAPTTMEAVLLHIADKTSTDLYFLQEARSEAEEGITFVKQGKLDSGFGSMGRIVFVGDIGSSLPAAQLEVPASKPEAYPIPPDLRLPVLRLLTEEDALDGPCLTRMLPIYGKIAAGEPLLHSDNQEGEALIEAMALVKGSYYLLRVKGDSMTGDGIQDGDLIVVKEHKDPELGALLVVLLDGEGATVKRLTFKEGKVYLVSSNPAYGPIVVSNVTDLQVQGRVIAIARSLGPS